MSTPKIRHIKARYAIRPELNQPPGIAVTVGWLFSTGWHPSFPFSSLTVSTPTSTFMPG